MFSKIIKDDLHKKILQNFLSFSLGHSYHRNLWMIFHSNVVFMSNLRRRFFAAYHFTSIFRKPFQGSLNVFIVGFLINFLSLGV